MPTRKPTGAFPGRPPKFKEPMASYVVTLTQEMANFAKTRGGGNRSEGIRQALRAQMQIAEGSPWKT